MKLSQQAGDTIVEVLIAIIIVSTVLGGAFVSANRSLTATRDSQERGEALKFGEEQVERLKAGVSATPDTYFNATNVFCIDGTNMLQPATNSPNYSIDALPLLTADSLNNYNNSCIRSNIYHLATEYYGGTDNVFKVHVRWQQIGGNAKDEIVLIYRINKLP